MKLPDHQSPLQGDAAYSYGVHEFTQRIPLRGPVRPDLRQTETAALRRKTLGFAARTVGISWLKVRASLRTSE